MLPINDLQKNKLFRKLCSEAAKAAAEYQMLREGDHILVGISGGEDSLTLMHILDNLRRRTPFTFQISAVTVNMEFAGFDIQALSRYCEFYEWDWRCVSIPGQFLLKEKGAEERPCALCSRLRRGQLHGLADQLGCNKIALGQQLDDLCVSLLMALFRGGGLKTMGPNVPADGCSKRLIRPLCTIPKAEIHRLAQILEYPAIKSCPYEEKLNETGDRAYLEKLVEHLGQEHFGDIRGAMLNAMRDVRLNHLLDTRYISLENEDLDAGKL